MPASGARTGTIPNRPTRGGTGRIGDYTLTCGHVSPASPAVHTSGDAHHARYWCDQPDCRCFRRRR